MSQLPISEKRKPGRPQSQAARTLVLEAAYRILMNEGLGRLSVERVAAETGVSKPTIYRSWTNAHELAMAAFMAHPQQESGALDSLPVRVALAVHLQSVIAAFSTQRGRQITLTMASSSPESELAKAFRNQVILKSRESGRQLLLRAILSNEVSAECEVEVALDMLYGALFFRLLAGHLPLSPDLAASLIKTVFAGISGKAIAL